MDVDLSLCMEFTMYEKPDEWEQRMPRTRWQPSLPEIRGALEGLGVNVRALAAGSSRFDNTHDELPQPAGPSEFVKKLYVPACVEPTGCRSLLGAGRVS